MDRRSTSAMLILGRGTGRHASATSAVDVTSDGSDTPARAQRRPAARLHHLESNGESMMHREHRHRALTPLLVTCALAAGALLAPGASAKATTHAASGGTLKMLG